MLSQEKYFPLIFGDTTNVTVLHLNCVMAVAGYCGKLHLWAKVYYVISLVSEGKSFVIEK